MLEVGDTVAAETAEYQPETAMLSAERGRIFRSAVAGLSVRERQILTLVHVHHLGGAEIGRELGVSESRISQILSGVRSKLRDSVEAYDSVA